MDAFSWTRFLGECFNAGLDTGSESKTCTSAAYLLEHSYIVAQKETSSVRGNSATTTTPLSSVPSKYKFIAPGIRFKGSLSDVPACSMV